VESLDQTLRPFTLVRQRMRHEAACLEASSDGQILATLSAGNIAGAW